MKYWLARLRSYFWTRDNYPNMDHDWCWRKSRRDVDLFLKPNPLKFGWWASADDEHFTIGPYATREQALRIAQREGMGDDFNGVAGCNRVYLVEAAQAPVQLARYVDADLLMERVCEAAEDDFAGEDSLFDDGCGTDEQSAELTAALRRVVRRWQRRHRIVIKPYVFTHYRSRESYTYFTPEETAT